MTPGVLYHAPAIERATRSVMNDLPPEAPYDPRICPDCAETVATGLIARMLVNEALDIGYVKKVAAEQGRGPISDDQALRASFKSALQTGIVLGLDIGLRLADDRADLERAGAELADELTPERRDGHCLTCGAPAGGIHDSAAHGVTAHIPRDDTDPDNDSGAQG